MKAIVQDKYGSAEVLRARDIEKPKIGDDEVLIRVHAASVHIGDWVLMTGSPFVMRFATGLRRPKNRVPGTDVAGTVEAIGKDVERLRPGDEVFGWCAGAFAEYVSASEEQFLLKPASLTFEQAAAVGVSATTALQLLRDNGKVQRGQKVLVNGASGGVGTFAVQIAKAFGAEVTGVTSTRNVDLVRSIGADHVIDYTRDDFTKGAERYDLILDNVGNHSMAQTRRVLAPTGTLISNGGGHVGGKLGRTIRTMLVSMLVRQQAGPTVKTQNRDDLAALKELVEAGKVTPVIDGTYPLSETPKAIARVASGRARGTLVIAVLEARPAVGSEDTLLQASVAASAVARPLAPRRDGRVGRLARSPLDPTKRKELAMSKAMVTRLFIGAGLALIAGAILAIAGVWVAIANDVFVMNGPDIVGLRGSAVAWSTLGVATAGVIAIMGGLLAGLVAWIGALLTTWQLESKAWFVGLLLLGIFNLGFFAMVAYLIAGPDGRTDAAGKVEPVARPTPA